MDKELKEQVIEKDLKKKSVPVVRTYNKRKIRFCYKRT